MAIAYSEHLITYVDVLGFRDLIKKSRNDNALVREIEDQLNQFIGWFEKFGPPGMLHSFNFSDHVVRATEVDANSNLVDHFNREAYYIAERQLQMAMQGWFLRGAVSIGAVSTGDKIIFGPGLVRAYDLESTVAVYPRIVIDPLLLARTKESHSSSWHDYRWTDQDGITFVNYLFAVFIRRFSFPDPSERDPWKALDDHCTACLTFLDSEKAKQDLRVRQKAVWAGNYHNESLIQLAQRFEGRPECGRFDSYKLTHELLDGA